MTAARQMLVAIIGVDGSGKTTASEGVVRALGVERAARVWLGAESVLMAPLRMSLSLLRRGLFARKPSRNAGYRGEIEQKHTMVRRLARFEPIYVRLILADYRLQYLWKRWRSRDVEILVTDRYFYDVAVNLALTLNWPAEKLIAFLQRHIGNYGLPQVRCLVSVSPETVMQRKDDVPDRSYIALRVDYYRAIADAFGFEILDGEAAPETVRAQILARIEGARERMHVHYVHANNPDLGGADFCLCRLAREMGRRNWDVSVSLRLPTRIVADYQADGIPVLVGGFHRPQVSRGVLGLCRLPYEITASLAHFVGVFRRHRPDLVHVNDLYDFAPAIAARLLGIPVVYHIRMIRTRDAERKLFSWLISWSARVSFSVSGAVRSAYFDTAAPRFGHRPEVVPDWANDTLVAEGTPPVPADLASHERRVVMVGRLEHWKGQHVFVDAVSKIAENHPDVGFYLIGGRVEGKGKQDYADAVIAAAEAAGVTYLGERNDVPAILRNADISVHASVRPDPFPGVVLESLLSGAAVIGADDGGVPEMIRHERDGLLVTPGDAAGLARAIDALLKDPDRCERLAKFGRARTLVLTDKARILHLTETLYHDATGHAFMEEEKCQMTQ